MRTLEESPLVIAEVASGQGISLASAAQRVPSFRPGKPTNVATLWRWGLDGIRLQDGTRLRLEVCRFGGRWVTTEAALARFIKAQTPRMESEQAEAPRTPTQRQKAADRATQQLDKIGI